MEGTYGDGLKHRFQPVMADGSRLPDTPQVWTPPVWSKGPDALVAEAKLDLFHCRQAIEHGALLTPEKAIAGAVPAMANEQEVLIQRISPGENMASEWIGTLKELFTTEPLYGHTSTLSGGHQNEQETANPNA
jgi:hypothetical protein